MDTLQINVKGWPEERVILVKKYAETVGSDLQKNLPMVPEEDRKRLAEEGTLRLGTQKLPDELKAPPSGPSPSGVLDVLLAERESKR